MAPGRLTASATGRGPHPAITDRGAACLRPRCPSSSTPSAKPSPRTSTAPWRRSPVSGSTLSSRSVSTASPTSCGRGCPSTGWPPPPRMSVCCVATPTQILDLAAELGITTVIDPAVTAERWASVDDIAAIAEQLNAAAEKAATRGLHGRLPQPLVGVRDRLRRQARARGARRQPRTGGRARGRHLLGVRRRCRRTGSAEPARRPRRRAAHQGRRRDPRQQEAGRCGLRRDPGLGLHRGGAGRAAGRRAGRQRGRPGAGHQGQPRRTC